MEKFLATVGGVLLAVINGIGEVLEWIMYVVVGLILVVVGGLISILVLALTGVMLYYTVGGAFSAFFGG